MTPSRSLHETPGLQGDEDDPETGVQSSFLVERPSAPRALTLFRLREMFPFEGTFHFRLKVCVWGGGGVVAPAVCNLVLFFKPVVASGSKAFETKESRVVGLGFTPKEYKCGTGEGLYGVCFATEACWFGEGSEMVLPIFVEEVVVLSSMSAMVRPLLLVLLLPQQQQQPKFGLQLTIMPHGVSFFRLGKAHSHAT